MTNHQKWTAEKISDQSGKTVIVTGANSGIGYEASAALVRKGAKVIMACRSVEKGKAAAAKIEQQNPMGEVILKQLDLADLSSVARFADDFLAEYEQLDILLNNAGVMAVPYRQTADGFEMQFGTNHLGHFALTGRLINILQKTPGSRVVTVSSFAHMIGKINFDDLNSEKSYQKWLAYGQSKLANILFAYELQRRAAETGNDPISIAVHPGYAATNLQRSSPFFRFANKFMAQSQEMGALPSLYAATHPDIQGGEYIGPDGFLGQRGYPKQVRSSSRSYDLETTKHLWEVSEELTGVQFDF